MARPVVDRLSALPRPARITLIWLTVVMVSLWAMALLVAGYVDWLWFGELGFRRVWVVVLATRLLLFVVVSVAVSVAMGTAMLLAYRSRPSVRPTASDDLLAEFRIQVACRPRLYGGGLAAIVGVLCGLVASSDWSVVQLFVHRGSFGVTDPEFGRDIGFFAFELPFYSWIVGWLFVVVLCALAAGAVAHYVFGGLQITGEKRRLMLTRSARLHVAVLGGIFIALKAWAYWLDRYWLLSGGRKEPTFTGAGYTDIHAGMPAKLVLLAISLLCAAAIFSVVVLRDMRVAAMAAALLVLSSVLVGGAWPLLMEQFSVRPNAAEVEQAYIARNIAATRQAYRLDGDRVEYRNYPGVGTAAPRQVPADLTTIANIRLLDPAVLSRTFTQQQQLKNFYSFPEQLDLDRYRIDGQLRDYVVALREMSPNNLTGNQRDWINRHTVYTHGNGFVAAPANRVNAAAHDAASTTDSNSGYPVYKISDITSTGSGRQIIPVLQPRIYFGEVIAQDNPDYAIVGNSSDSPPREYDTDTSRYTYSGAGGVTIGNWLTRAAFAARFSQHRILFSRAVSHESKVLFHRAPRKRVQRVAPWLTVDSDAYPAVVQGRIVWIVDAYTTLTNYPYAQRSSLPAPAPQGPAGHTSKSVSYARNSVKATVDAYDGTVTLYQVDEHDPVLQAWMRVFPGTVKPSGHISAELRTHFRYPQDLFTLQREILAKYHVRDPQEFFTTNAFWSVPTDPTNDDNPTQPPFYVLTGDAHSAAPSFRLASAMVGYNREFLAAYIFADSDPVNYGKITILQLPTDTLTQGPQQIQNSMISDTRVASERTLLERSNRIQYGNLLTLPIANGGVLYIEPLYTERIPTTSNSSTFPQLARVLVSVRAPRADGGVQVGYAPTLAQALDQIFGPGTGTAATAPDAGPARPHTTGTLTGPDTFGGTPETGDQLRQIIKDLRSLLDRLQNVAEKPTGPGQ